MQKEQKKPLIVGFVADLMFTMRIGNVVRHIGFDIEWVETAADVGVTASVAKQSARGEQLDGQGGALFMKVSKWQPALLLFDLDNEAIPWREWIAHLKSSPATRRFPIICFGSHMDVESMNAARKAGADQVFARSRFTSKMGELLQSHARIVDVGALTAVCHTPLPPLAAEGIALFNAGKYYDCHDALEEAWNQEDGPVRDLYRLILQIGIAYFQIERGNYRGALKMLMRLRQWFEPLPAVCQGVNIAALHQQVDAVQDALLALGAENITNFDQTLFKPIQLDVRP